MYPKFGIYWVHNLQEHGIVICFICLLKICRLFAFLTSFLRFVDCLRFFIRDFAVEQPGISMNRNERIS